MLCYYVVLILLYYISCSCRYCSCLVYVSVDILIVIRRMLQDISGAREVANETRMTYLCNAVDSAPQAVPLWQPPPDVLALVVAPGGDACTWEDVERLSR